MHEQDHREREGLTDELLRIGRRLADLPTDGAFGEKVDLRERQKELRLRLAELEDVILLHDEEEAAWDEDTEAIREADVIDLADEETVEPGFFARLLRH